MGSFYGGVSAGSSGSSASSSNYNDLTNVPIINKVGSESAPVNLEELPNGVYKVEGSFKYTTDGEIKNVDSAIVQVTTDKNGQKVVKTELFEDGNFKVQVITYADDEAKIEENSLINPVATLTWGEIE